MGIIRFKEANCKNCYKCLRSCQVKAIAFKNEQAEIIDSECVLCGHCFLVCPQNAKYIDSDIKKVKKFVAQGEKVYISIAPSYASYFNGVLLGKISGALKRLGAVRVEETAVGAARVSAEYIRLMHENKMKNIISTACPTSVLLVEKYYPELIPELAPCVSPMVAHAKMMREAYGDDIKIVFIGPCFQKNMKRRTTWPAGRE
jgi:iron only hydrogenase large subunit-like protein